MKDFAEWRAVLDSSGIIFGIVAKMENIPGDPQMLASEALVRLDAPPLRQVAPMHIAQTREKAFANAGFGFVEILENLNNQRRFHKLAVAYKQHRLSADCARHWA